MRGSIVTLECPAQRELDETRVADRLDNLPEWCLALGQRAASGGLDIRNCWISEVGVIPDIEKISREPKRLPFSQTEVLDQGEIPVLLERTMVNISSEIAEIRSAEVGVFD